MKTQIDSVLSSDQLPSLPQVAVRIIQLTQEPEPDFDQMVRVIKSDPAICGKVLKTANSALLGLPRRVSSIDAALPVLGATLVKTIVLSFSLASHQRRRTDITKYHRRHWKRSLTQAAIAESIALETECGDPPTFFLTGLLLDIGELALLGTLPDIYVEIQSSDLAPNQLEAEDRFLGFSHTELGAEICRRWKLDEELIEAVLRHHETLRLGAELSPRMLVAMAASQSTDLIESPYKTPPTGWETATQVLQDRLSLSGDELLELLQDVPLRVCELSAMFSFDIGEGVSDDDILRTAKSELEAIAIQSQMDAIAADQRAELVMSKVTQLEQQREALQNEANRDPLTGAYNRRFMTAALGVEIEQATEQGSSVGVMFADIDKFKQLNDTYGHSVGDAALVEVARVLRGSTRATDIVIRYGGDEFLVVLCGITYAKFRTIAHRVCNNIRNAQIACDEYVRISSSVGGVFYAPAAGASIAVDDLVSEVDQAMYEAKQQGGDRVHIKPFMADCEDFAATSS